ncbi:MAG: hypothetical protein O3C40_35525 [Planctomycetota bacterium]|nr:hypothetical protein [Planctomycetota bacterium]
MTASSRPTSLVITELTLLLRVYDGCARTYRGEIEDTNLVKLDRYVARDSVAAGGFLTRSVEPHSPKVSYLSYPDFETDPHPALARSVKLNLRTRELDCWDYFSSDNPPILHRKETFLPVAGPEGDQRT